MKKVIETKNLISVYETGLFIGNIENNTKEIANLVAGASPYHKYSLVDSHFKLILTTIGSFLDNVPNQQWLQKELLPILVPLQTGQEEIQEVKFQKIDNTN